MFISECGVIGARNQMQPTAVVYRWSGVDLKAFSQFTRRQLAFEGRRHRSMQRRLTWLTGICVLAVPALLSVTSCGSSTSAIACAGQCAPPYELQVDFHAGTTPATAHKVLTSCAGHNPVVIRVGTLR